MLNDIVAIGIMTGNSLDGADLVATRFSADGFQTDIAAYAIETPALLREGLRWLRQKINEANGDTATVARDFARGRSPEAFSFDDVSDRYIHFIAEAVRALVSAARARDPEFSVDLIGLHGQTCAACPPSIAKTKDPHALYTVQLGDGQQLADLTGIPVVFDFRSDDLMNLGEAAPLAPLHHQHLAQQLRRQGYFPIAFANAGNTGNLTIVSEREEGSAATVSGWDTGPFNNFPDKLTQREKGLACDEGGRFGSLGRVHLGLLSELFHYAVITRDGGNFLLQPPPRSSDPEWYRMLPGLTGEAPINGALLSFEDRLRTAEYFSAYIYFHTLGFVPAEIQMPRNFALCGGGWKNPVVLRHFRGLLAGDIDHNPVLPEHSDLFAEIRRRMSEKGAGPATCEFSDWYGFDGTAMEARIFADAAVCRITGTPFSIPETTGVSKPTVAGIIRFPKGDPAGTTPRLRLWLEEHGSRNLTVDRPDLFDGRWSRASAGWFERLNRA